jgi:uncharacterized protein (TIGR02145 family)
MKNLIFILILTITIIFILLFLGCKREIANTTLPLVTIKKVDSITIISAFSGGNVNSDGSSTITQRGICWSTNTNPTISDYKTIDGEGNGEFFSKMNNLTPNTIYYIRAYASNSFGTGYSNQIPLKTYTGSTTDIDGNIYNTITIGSQIWMVENLKTTKYRNGDAIPKFTEGMPWNNLTTGAYCDYNDEENYSDIYGRLYNWYAVDEWRKLAPLGWHVASDSEWTILTNYFGGLANSASKLKEAGNDHWKPYTVFSDNSSGFKALPSGERDESGYKHIGEYTIWWCSTNYSTSSAWWRDMFYRTDNINRWSGHKSNGYSVRCIKD